MARTKYTESHTTSRALSTIGRIIELASSSIVAGLLGRYLWEVNDNSFFHVSSRIYYTISLAGISIFAALVLLPPLAYQFYAWPLDGILFVMWMVAFGLLLGLSPGCSRFWYFREWPYNCGRWRAVIAWSFVAGFVFLLNMLLGLYFVSARRDERKAMNATRNQDHEKYPSGNPPLDAPLNTETGVAPAPGAPSAVPGGNPYVPPANAGAVPVEGGYAPAVQK